VSQRYLQLARIAARSVLRFRLQSGLILLAAAIGVDAAIAASAVTLGARDKIDIQFVHLGAELIVVTPKLPITGARRGTPAKIAAADYATLKRELPGVRSSASAVLSVRVQAGAVSKKTPIVGVEPAFFAMKHWGVREGRLFATADNRHLDRVALLGSSVARALFGHEVPVGESILINRVPFMVVGVLAARGQSVDAVDEDQQVYVPLRSLMHRLADTRGYVSLTFDAGMIGRVDSLSRRIALILTARHRVDPATAFRIEDRKSTIDAQTATFARLTTLSRGVALVLYVMASLGIFAISWLAVGARTAQIGTMRALGSRREDVLFGFFLEGALPSLMGCIAGWVASPQVCTLLGSLAEVRTAFAPAFASRVTLLSGLLFAALSSAAATRGAFIGPTEAMRSS
jgi:ABC-type antimicrobial peptide transport system permease subunit